MPGLLKFIHRDMTPPDGFRFTFSEDGHKVTANDLQAWFREIKKHYDDNGYDLPENWQALAEDQCCKLMPPGWCEYSDGGTPDAFVDGRIYLEDILNGTRVLASFVAHGWPLVPQALADERASTCARCFMNVPTPGCSPCVGLLNVIDEIAGGRKTVADAQLATKSCAVCKCVSRAHVWLPIEILNAGITPKILSLFPEHCWKRRESTCPDSQGELNTSPT